MAERSKVTVYGPLLVGIAGSNPAGGMDVLSVVNADLETSSMRRPWPALGCCARNKQTGSFPVPK